MPIRTVGRLKQYIGKPILLYYGNENSNHSTFAWISTPSKLESSVLQNTTIRDNTHIRGIAIYGYNLLVIRKNGKKANYFLTKEANEEKLSNAQDYIRTLTKEEFEMYKNITRKRRILKRI